jgi:ornithine carbamoyltransferase
MDVRIAAAAAMWPSDDLITTAQDLGAESGARLLITPDAGHAVPRAMFVVAGAWAPGNVLAGTGDPPPAYLVTEDFLATSGPSTTWTLFGDAEGEPERLEDPGRWSLVMTVAPR